MNNISFSVNPQAFIDSLSIMGMGMLGIFAVTAVIILLIKLLNFAFK